MWLVAQYRALLSELWRVITACIAPRRLSQRPRQFPARRAEQLLPNPHRIPCPLLAHLPLAEVVRPWRCPQTCVGQGQQSCGGMGTASRCTVKAYMGSRHCPGRFSRPAPVPGLSAPQAADSERRLSAGFRPPPSGFLSEGHTWTPLRSEGPTPQVSGDLPDPISAHSALTYFPTLLAERSPIPSCRAVRPHLPSVRAASGQPRPVRSPGQAQKGLHPW